MTVPRSGRRVADRTPRQVAGGTVAAAVLVAVAVVAVLLTGSAAPDDDRSGGTEGVLVDHALDGCLRADPPRGTRTSVVTGAAPVRGLGSGGSIRFGEPGELAGAEERTPARGELVVPDPGRGETADVLAVEATGELAAGLFTFRSDTGDGTAAVARCDSPRAQWWFTGAAATLTHTSELVVANLDPGAAVVDVRVLGPEGEVETLGTRGITVPPLSSTVLELTELAPQGEDLAVNVVASRGRVVAGLSDSYAPEFGSEPGTEWLPDQASASRVVRLAGLPRRADEHVLVVANPSGREALVAVEVSGESGSFTPTDVAQVRVPPGAVVSTPVTEAVPGGAAAVTLRSPVPVTATVRSTAGGDTSYAGSVRALAGPAVAAVPDRLRSSVQLTGGEQGGTAGIVAYDAAGAQVGATTLRLDPGATSAWSPAGRAAYVVVEPREGRVHGAVAYAGDAGLSQVSLRPVLVRVTRPAVRPVVAQSAS